MICKNCNKEFENDWRKDRNTIKYKTLEFCSLGCTQSFQKKNQEKVECEKCHNFFTKQTIAKHKKACKGFYKKRVSKGNSHLPTCICKICGEGYSIQNIKRHEEICKGEKRKRFSRDVYKNKEGFFECRFCQETFESFKNLKLHWKSCEEAFRDSLGRVHYILHGSFVCQFCGRSTHSKGGNTSHEKTCYLNPDRVEIKGHPHTKESRAKLTAAAVERVKRQGVYGAPRFNEEACKYIDQLNLEKGWHLQHAMNGGEISCAPYYMDGYDKERNICFEYFEKAHFSNPEKIKKDEMRLAYIREKLGCSIFVFNEKENKLEQRY